MQVFSKAAKTYKLQTVLASKLQNLQTDVSFAVCNRCFPNFKTIVLQVSVSCSFGICNFSKAKTGVYVFSQALVPTITQKGLELKKQAKSNILAVFKFFKKNKSEKCFKNQSCRS